MGVFRFENKQAKLERVSSEHFENHFILTSSLSNWKQWRDAFENEVLKEHKELRHPFNEELTLFWKSKELGESRILLAHPEVNEWVASVILNLEDIHQLLLEMDKLGKSKTQISFSQLGVWSHMGSITGRGNLDLTIQLEKN